MLHIQQKRTFSPRTKPVKTLVVLGSGGHTKEMLTLLQEIPSQKYKPAIFIRAEVSRMTCREGRVGMIDWRSFVLCHICSLMREVKEC